MKYELKRHNLFYIWLQYYGAFINIYWWDKNMKLLDKINKLLLCERCVGPFCLTRNEHQNYVYWSMTLSCLVFTSCTSQFFLILDQRYLGVYVCGCRLANGVLMKSIFCTIYVPILNCTEEVLKVVNSHFVICGQIKNDSF